MGALTLKSFPFELRGWDIEKFESIDPTDGFGTNTRVYISKQIVIQIEPDHAENTTNAWLSDKGRQFFDGIFGTWNNRNEQSKNLIFKKESWQKNLKTLLKTLYLFEHCNVKTKKTYFFTVVFENLGIQTLSLLKLIEQKYSFLKLRRAENLNMPYNFEFNFQLNTASDLNILKSSTLCLLVANNPRYEGYHLNMKLRQRYLKGNFKCLVLGSLVDLTFPNINVGTNFKLLKEIAEGNSFVCQDFKTSKKPMLIFGSEFYKRTDCKNVLEMFNKFNYTNIVNKTWNGLNSLNATLSEVGTQTLNNFLSLKDKDFCEFSSLYFVNVNAQNIPNLKKITETKLLIARSKNLKKRPNIDMLFLDQNSRTKNNQTFSRNCFEPANNKNYNFLPSTMFYENEETFINTEGFIKKTNKLITKRKTRSGWKLLRNLLKQLKTKYVALDYKNNNILSFNANKQSNFTHFFSFNYCAVEKLESLTPFLTVKNQPFIISKTNTSFKQMPLKIKNTKSKYWIDDFFTGGKDEYSGMSLVLSNCSKIQRTQSTTFF